MNYSFVRAVGLIGAFIQNRSLQNTRGMLKPIRNDPALLAARKRSEHVDANWHRLMYARARGGRQFCARLGVVVARLQPLNPTTRRRPLRPRDTAHSAAVVLLSRVACDQRSPSASVKPPLMRRRGIQLQRLRAAAIWQYVAE